MTRAQRAPVAGVLGAVALAVGVGAWTVARTAWRDDDVRARLAADGTSEAVPGPTPPASFTCDLDYPRAPLHAWGKALGAARDGTIPAPPDEIAAWLATHEAEVDALTERVLATGPLDLPAFERPVINAGDATHPYVAAAHALELLVGAAVAAALAGRWNIAERRLEAAWTLRESTWRTSRGLGPDFLGAMRLVKTTHPRVWLQRLEQGDRRADSVRRLLTRAQYEAWCVEQSATAPFPSWYPDALRPLARDVTRLRSEWIGNPFIDAALDARDEVGAQEPCGDPADLADPVVAWASAVPMMDWLPSARRARARDAHFAETSRTMGDATLTMHVLALRAGGAGWKPPCGGPRFHVEPVAGGVRVAADRPDLAASLAFDVPMSVAPGVESVR